jgi:hypothetical protein
MSKIISLAIIMSAAIFAAGCGDSVATNQRVNNNAATNSAANRTPVTNVQPPAAPTNTAVPAATPANSAPAANTNSASQAERPRVIDPKKTSKAATPSDEIPSQDEMRKAFSKPVTQEDVNNPGMRKSEPMMRTKSGDATMMRSKPAEVPMMKSNKKPGEKP